MPSSIQRSFSGGEITPALHGRADQAKYQTGLAKCMNFIVQREGGITNRPGTEFITEVKDTSLGETSLRKFVFSDAVKYLLEFGDSYMRVISNGAQVTEAQFTVTAVTQTNPVEITTSAAHGYATGDQVLVKSVVGTTEINDFKYFITFVNATKFELTGIDGTGHTSYVSGGTVERIFELATPFLQSEVTSMKMVQSLDVMYIVHENHRPQKLTHSGPSSWTIGDITFDPLGGARPSALAASGSAGTVVQKYQVTAVDKDDFEESLVGVEAVGYAMTAVTQANPGTVTAAGHNFADGDVVLIRNVTGMRKINERVFVVTNVSGGDFDLQNEDTTGYTAYSAGGTVYRLSAETTALQAALADPVTVSWTAVANASDYNIYKEEGGIYGFIGTTTDVTFDDIGASPDISASPPFGTNPFLNTGNFPKVVGLMQQSLWFANTVNEPESIWKSRTGFFENFSRFSPSQSDDSFKFNLNSEEFNEVRWITEIGRPLIFTQESVWALFGNETGTVTPGQVNARLQERTGATDQLPPLKVQGTGVYMQSRNKIVRDLRSTGDAGQFRGRDLTLFASHFFKAPGFLVDSWDYQENPHSVIWCAQQNGVVLGLTYVPEHEVWGWHQHLFTPNGRVIDFVVVPEGNDDVLYVLINRGNARLIERMTSRQVLDIKTDAKFCDSNLSYDGASLTLAGVDGSATMALTGAPFTHPTSLTLTASDATFKSTDVGNAVILDENGNSRVVLTITGFTSDTVVTVEPNKDVPTAHQSGSTKQWCLAVKSVKGLDHLEGEDACILADGQVQVPITVVNGQITLDNPFCHIHVGLPYVSDMFTLDLEQIQGETLMDKKARINKATLLFEESRGGEAGPSFTDMHEIKQRDNEDYDDPVDEKTGRGEVLINATWRDEKRVAVRQSDPLPMTILSIVPSGLVGE